MKSPELKLIEKYTLAASGNIINHVGVLDEATVDIDPEFKSEIPVKVDGVNILILTSSLDSKHRTLSKKNPTILKIESWCRDHNIPVYTAYADTAYIDKLEETYRIHNIGDGVGHIIDRDNTFIIARRGVMFHKYSKNLMLKLEKMRFCFLNERRAIECCEDKYNTQLHLTSDDINVPRSALIPNENMIDLAHEKIGGSFPVVIKTLSGTQGKGVFIVDNKMTMKSVLQTMWSVSDSVDLMMQEYIKSDYDIRVHVLGDEVIAAMKRHIAKEDFRSNVHLGADTEEIELTDEIKDLAIRAAKATKCKWAGVDIIFDEKSTPYVIEVNASAGTDGIEALLKVSIVDKVMRYCIDGRNWNRAPQEIGVIETINIKGIGEVAARFDTGNACASSSLDAQNIKIDEYGLVTWKTGDIEVSAAKTDEVKIKNNKDSEGMPMSRPIVQLDVTFQGVTYKNIPFNLNDRSHKATPVLINKDFMIRSGSVINPAKTYSVTSKPKENSVPSEDHEMLPEDEREEN